ncbi:MAG TPA: hypothetical protein VFG42_17525 [Baekduia sp.]|uniref:hypothetical protein n=1 Tax=Baekduia sp. TaxID=2600305 RepID=UPI002D799C4D|nr:hypothetical protein [Baekduia sp.]HET6508597.1 hypothetical protein [Baekduia sp.]
MAPATVAGASSRRTATGQGRRSGWDRENVIEAIQEWVAAHGAPPRAADWNPSSAKWSGQRWRVERYRAGRADGSAWPALNSAKRPFGGSLNAAIRAAGFEPAKPGPTRRADVDPEQADRAIISPEGRAMLEAALAQAREAEKRVAVLEARLARRGERERERVVVSDDAAIARAQRATAAAEARADQAIAGARERTTAAKAEATDARRTARRRAARLERAEATIASLRAERRELKTTNATLADRLTTTERDLASARADALAAEGEAKAAQAAMREAARAMRDSARAAEAKARTTVKANGGALPGGSALGDRDVTANGPARHGGDVTANADGADALVALAQAEATAARRAAREAEARAATLARDLAAMRGEARALTASERAELRSGGPSGPAVLAASLKGLARARDRSRTGHDTSATALAAALLDVAAAAVSWRERL